MCCLAEHFLSSAGCFIVLYCQLSVYLSSTFHREQVDHKQRDARSLRGWNVDDLYNKYTSKRYIEGGKIIGFIYTNFTMGQYSNYRERPTWAYDKYQYHNILKNKNTYLKV